MIKAWIFGVHLSPNLNIIDIMFRLLASINLLIFYMAIPVKSQLGNMTFYFVDDFDVDYCEDVPTAENGLLDDNPFVKTCEGVSLTIEKFVNLATFIGGLGQKSREKGVLGDFRQFFRNFLIDLGAFLEKFAPQASKFLPPLSGQRGPLEIRNFSVLRYGYGQN